MDKGAKKKQIALYSVIVGIILTFTKLIAGIVSGSLGILSEALHSFLDLGAACITFFSVRYSARPPDSTHQYGHGKIENLSALAQALLLFATCAWIVYEAVRRLAGKAFHVEASFLAFFVMIFALVLDIIISRVLYRGAKKYSSQALEADALHYSSDILSSAVVIIGLIGVKFGINVLDPIAALVVALLVIIASYRLSKRAVEELLDKAPPGVDKEIVQRINSMAGGVKVENIRVRRSGASTFVDLIVGVRRGIPVSKGHKLTDEIEDEVKKIVPDSSVLVHLHPTSYGETITDTVQAVAQRFDKIQDVHNIQAYKDEKSSKYFLSLHVKLVPSLSLEDAHAIIDELEAELAKEMPQVENIETHIETADTMCNGSKRPLSSEKMQRLCAEVKSDARIKGIHDAFIHETGCATILSCHVFIEKGLSLNEAHEVATYIEEKVKQLFKDINDVVVHTEPFEGK